MKFARSLLVVLVLLSTSNLVAQEDTKPWWNPFAKSSESSEVRESSFFNGESADPEPMIKLPKLPWFSKSESTEPSKPKKSTFSKMGAATKKFWGSTVDFVNPFNDGSKTDNNFQGRGYQPQNLREEPKGRFSWLWPKKADPEPASVNDFLRMERPKF